MLCESMVQSRTDATESALQRRVHTANTAALGVPCSLNGGLVTNKSAV